MKSYNVDNLLTDRETIERAIVTVCKSKKNKNKGANHKYKKAQKILGNIDFYVDDMLGIMLATKEAYTKQHNGMIVEKELLNKMYIPKNANHSASKMVRAEKKGISSAYRFTLIK